MSHWSEGYVSEIDYTYGYYHDLNPVRSALPLIKAGIKPPTIQTACELGFGQGVSINVHAAASSTEWYGTDVNPTQVNFARELVSLSGAACNLFDQPFDEFCKRSDLPDFDFIGLHGVWSWVSRKNRKIIKEFILKKLRVGGMLYVSYNTLPGWAQMLPFRDLLLHHVNFVSGRAESMTSRIDNSINFMNQILDVQPFLAKSNPVMFERFKKSKGLSRNYLAHEYFNSDWHPFSFLEASREFSSVKLSYVGSSHYLDHIDIINFTEEQLHFLSRVQDPTLREATRDFISGQPFRRDYWIKGPTRLSAVEQNSLLAGLSFILIRPKQSLELKIKGLRGEGDIEGHLYKAFLEAIPDIGIPFSLGSIREQLAKKLSIVEIVQATFSFAAKGDLLPLVDSRAVTQKVRSQSFRFNNAVIERSLAGVETLSLASPRLAGGVEMDRVQQTFLKHFADTEDENLILRCTLEDLAKNGKQLVKDGKPLDNEDGRHELKRHFERFKENLVLYKELGLTS